jgi:hypothetical protein
MRKEIIELIKLGPLPAGTVDSDPDLIDRYADLIQAIIRPVTDEEACALVKLFGPDDCFGVAWSLLHLIETAPSWPIAECLRDRSNEWVRLLAASAARAGLLAVSKENIPNFPNNQKRCS